MSDTTKPTSTIQNARRTQATSEEQKIQQRITVLQQVGLSVLYKVLGSEQYGGKPGIPPGDRLRKWVVGYSLPLDWLLFFEGKKIEYTKDRCGVDRIVSASESYYNDVVTIPTRVTTMGVRDFAKHVRAAVRHSRRRLHTLSIKQAERKLSEVHEELRIAEEKLTELRGSFQKMQKFEKQQTRLQEHQSTSRAKITVENLQNLAELSDRQVSRLFNVSERTVRQWLNGEEIGRYRTSRLEELWRVIEPLGENTTQRRKQLFSSKNGQSVFHKLLESTGT